MLRELDLTNRALQKFIVAYLAFVQCRLDGVSFEGTNFSFRASFINCSLVNADFRRTKPSSTLFYKCDLSGVQFDANPWISVDLNRQQTPSYFLHCVIDDVAKSRLKEAGNVVIEAENWQSHPEAHLEIERRLYEIVIAPVLDA